MPSAPIKAPTAPRFPRGGLRALAADDLEDEAIYRGVTVEDQTLEDRSLTSVSFEGCVFRRVNLRGARWHRVRCADVRFEGCDFGGAQLQELSLERVQVTDSRLLGAQLPEARLRHVRLTRAHAPLSLWLKADTKAFWAEDSDFSEATFMDAQLTGAVFRACRLPRAEFGGAALADADLRGSALAGARLGLRELPGVTVEAVQLLDLAHLLGVQVAELQ